VLLCSGYSPEGEIYLLLSSIGMIKNLKDCRDFGHGSVRSDHERNRHFQISEANMHAEWPHFTVHNPDFHNSKLTLSESLHV